MRTSISERAARGEPLRDLIGREARRAGFDAVAVTSPDAIPLAAGRLKQSLAEGFHGSMDWLAETALRRGSPKALWPEVRSVIVLAMNYGPDRDPREILAKPDRGAISVYAQNRDYHDIIKGRLKEMAGRVVARVGGDVKVFVDTAPVMEKPLAEAAGIGWQGKHTNLVSREFGSWLLLGTIFCTAEIAPDAPDEERCGSCRACLDACPTDAFPAPYRLDARRCISYLTIENKGPIPEEFRAAIGNRIYGCDDCLAACPWNKFAQAASEAKLIARDDLREPRLAELLALDDAGFRTLFSGSPVKRIGRNRFLRNVLIAAGNSGNAELVAPCRALLADAGAMQAVTTRFAHYDWFEVGWGDDRFKEAGFRAVPGAIVRRSAFIGPEVVLMPSFVNVGARVEAKTMVDTWVTIGSCAQIGKNCHISGGVGIGGVLEPLQAGPVIIEDNCFIGARSEVAEGVIVRKGSVLSMGVFLGASTKIVDRATGEVFVGEVPEYSVVVPGALPGKPLPDGTPGPSLACAVIVKRVDEKTRSKTGINELLRD